jgi:succinyl-diaminopimelate desuccinylase
MSGFDSAKKFIDENISIAVELEKNLTEIKALAPENGGDGESEKCAFLEKFLAENGITRLTKFEADDERVSSKKRPNLIAEIPGVSAESVWVCTHMDVVPAGEISLWETDPWTAVEKNGKIFGRGTEDNQQGLASGVLAAIALVKEKIVPQKTLKLLFMADEEVGSNFGMKFLLANHAEIFSKNDRILIPDGGDEKGETIEIAEENILWLKFHTKGKQAHGSRPDQGCNAKIASSYLALKIHELEKILTARDEMFEPDRSTFQPTMQMQNVSGVNIIPGDDVFCCDCRILPCYPLNEIREKVKKIVLETEGKFGVKIETEELQAEESMATGADSAVAKELAQAIEKVHGKKTRFIGIGGGTVAASLRNAGFDAVVWSTMDEKAHQPNEYAVTENIAADAKTIAFMACGI